MTFDAPDRSTSSEQKISQATSSSARNLRKCNCGFAPVSLGNIYNHIQKMARVKRKCPFCEVEYCYFSQDCMRVHSLREHKKPFELAKWKTFDTDPDARKEHFVIKVIDIIYNLYKISLIP